MSNNNNNMGTRVNLRGRIANVQRRYREIIDAPSSMSVVVSAMRWDALGNHARSTIQYIQRHNLTNYAATAGFTRTLRRMIARSNTYDPNARANSNNNTRSPRANLAQELRNQVATIRRNYSRLLSNRNTFNSTPAQWNALGNQSRAVIRYIVSHNLMNYALDAGFDQELRRMIARARTYDPNARTNNNSARANNNNARTNNARANNSNSGSNNNARANNSNSGSNNNATNRRTGGVVAGARAGRERVAAEVNHMRTVNTRLASLQGRYNRLIDPSFTEAGIAEWTSLGNNAESLNQYI